MTSISPFLRFPKKTYFLVAGEKIPFALNFLYAEKVGHRCLGSFGILGATSMFGFVLLWMACNIQLY